MSFGISGLSGGSHSYGSSSSNPFGQFINGVAQAIQSYEEAHKTAASPAPAASTPTPTATELPPTETVTPTAAATPAEQTVTPQPVPQAETSTTTTATATEPMSADESLHSLITQAESASATSDSSGITSIGARHQATTSQPSAAETVLRSKAEIMAQAAYSMVAQADNRNSTQALLKHA
jgi:hypothetical protein